jgi:hypothetical protein
MTAALPRAVYCTGGPLDGYGFMARDWEVRVEAARNLGRGAALDYRPGDAPDLTRRPKTAETLKGWAVTWMEWAPPA